MHCSIVGMPSNVQQKPSKTISSPNCVPSTTNTSIAKCNGYDMPAAALGLLNWQTSKLGSTVVLPLCFVVTAYVSTIRFPHSVRP